jgi:hypothetical protein
MAVAVSTCITLLALLVSLAGVVSAAVAIEESVVVCRAVYGAIFGTVPFASGFVTSVGGNVPNVVILVGKATVLNTVITALMAAMFAFILNMFSHCFFFRECFPCPGPGILNVMYY